MRPKNYKGGSCTKRKLNKCEDIAKTYDKIQTAFSLILDREKSIENIMCNVPMEDIEEGGFTTDFVCRKTDGDYLVRECVFKSKLLLPRTCKLLDISREYWLKRGITDWAIVVEQEGKNEK